MQLLNVIVHMHVALALMAYPICLTFESLLVLISLKLYSNRVITYTHTHLHRLLKNCFNEFHLE